MSDFYDAFKIECSPAADPEKIIVSGDTRITVLTDSLLRIEVTKNGAFCDEPTQAVWFRDFSDSEFTAEQSGNTITVKTKAAEFCYNTHSHKMKYINLSDGRHITNYKRGNLKGTRRTLDQTFGKAKIGDGIVSRNGVAVLCDSNSLVIAEDGTIVPRKSKGSDKYFFAYGYNYTEAVRDFFKLTGAPPLVPRFTLGNWWSRYKAYTQKEYISLMQRFIDEEIPITVATVDMDWHWVDVVGKFGKTAQSQESKTVTEKFYDAMSKGGWTGYSWNTDLFPDPKGFLKWLRDKNFKVTLNLHPATGVRWFEDQYDAFARFMGDDPKEGKQYAFDITDKKYVEGYFSLLHKPLENDGVDFWWIDWQQGTKTKVEGLDPLWALNHYHSMDIARGGGKRPLILSRFAGAGSHRYPLGFSGDTAQNWEVLDFQPYFTATASNIGYTWWSHDIGGHHFGRKDDELYTRWVQYGIFSPVMRLHSTSNEFMGKEPWKYSYSAQTLAVDALRFRHRMLPYLYTMNYRTNKEGRALIEPMYYHDPKDGEAYNHPNEYWFGSELIAAPITSPKDYHTNLAGVSVYLPKGRYTDIFTGRIYEGSQVVKMFRDERSIPVLAKEGAIIPLGVNDRNNNWKNPESMEILVYRGNGKFSMYEDDGETENYKKGAFAFTDFTVSENGDRLSFTIDPVRNDVTVVPQTRNYKISFKDVADAEASVKINGEASDAIKQGKKTVEIVLKDIKPDDKVEISFTSVIPLVNEDKRELLIELISKFQGKNNPKMKKYTDYVNGKAKIPPLPSYLREPLEEIEKLYY